MSKTIGDTYKNLDGNWLIVQYDAYTDEFICQKIWGYEMVIKNFKRSIVEGEK